MIRALLVSGCLTFYPGQWATGVELTVPGTHRYVEVWVSWEPSLAIGVQGSRYRRWEFR